MSRFFVPPEALHGKKFSLTGSEAHHAIHVLRKKVGDILDLFDGKDRSFRGRIDQMAGHTLEGTLLEEGSSCILPIRVNLYQALCRGAKWDWSLEKAGEIGVARVIPVETERSLVKIDVAAREDRLARWNRIALAASKQCGRSDVLGVETPCSLAEALSSLEPDSLTLIPWEKEITKTIKDALSGTDMKAVNIFIGPEGGWDPREVEHAIQAHAIPVRLGPTLLRTETAGLIATVLVLREYGVY